MISSQPVEGLTVILSSCRRLLSSRCAMASAVGGFTIWHLIATEATVSEVCYRCKFWSNTKIGHVTNKKSEEVSVGLTRWFQVLGIPTNFSGPLHWSFWACRTVSKFKIFCWKDHKHSVYCLKLFWRHNRHSSCSQIMFNEHKTIILLLKWAGKVLHWSKLRLVKTYFWRFTEITWNDTCRVCGEKKTIF